MLGPENAIEAPAPVQSRRGLLEATVPLEVGQARWERGFHFDPISCAVVGPLPIGCAPMVDAKDVPPAADLVRYEPVLLLGADSCSATTRGADTEARTVERARMNLRQTAGFQLERELWTGTQQQEGGLAADGSEGGQWLARQDATDLGTHGLARALAELEEALAVCLHGQRAMIHATPYTVTLWKGLGLVDLVGNLLLTAMDSIVVAGSGYTGSAPDGTPPADLSAAAYAYGTGLVHVARATERPVGNGLADRLDRATNTFTTYVEQEAAAVWSGCCHVAVEVDHASSGVDTSGGVDGGSP